MLKRSRPGGTTSLSLVVGVFLLLILLLILHCGIAARLRAETPNETGSANVPTPSVFEIPRILDTQRLVAALAHEGEFTTAESTLEGLVHRYPSLPLLHYELAALQIREGRQAEAIKSLTDAVAAGFPTAALEQDPTFEVLHADPAFQAIIKSKVPPGQAAVVNSIEATPVERGIALVSAANTAWDPRIGMLRTFFRFPAKLGQPNLVATDVIGAEQLNSWYLQGTAAGNYGDLYDNRDGGHSLLPAQTFPQLARIQYSSEAQQVGLDRALDRFFLFNAPTVGNASLAVTGGPMWRSLPHEQPSPIPCR